MNPRQSRLKRRARKDAKYRRVRFCLSLSTPPRLRYQVFVCRYPPTMDAPIRISAEAVGVDPMWSLIDENEISYLSLSDGRDDLSCRLMSAEVGRNPLQLVKRSPIFTGAILDVPGFSFDCDPNTDRFLLILPRENTARETEVRLFLTGPNRLNCQNSLKSW